MTLQTLMNAIPVVGTLGAIIFFFFLGRRSGSSSGANQTIDSVKKALFRQYRIRQEQTRLKPELEELPPEKMASRQPPTQEQVDKLRERLKELKERE